MRFFDCAIAPLRMTGESVNTKKQQGNNNAENTLSLWKSVFILRLLLSIYRDLLEYFFIDGQPSVFHIHVKDYAVDNGEENFLAVLFQRVNIRRKDLHVAKRTQKFAVVRETFQPYHIHDIITKIYYASLRF